MIHEADVTGRLRRFLGRRQVPKHLAASSQAAEDEVRALARLAARWAPRGEAFGAWWERFEEALGQSGRGYWPNEGDVAAAARAASAPSGAVDGDAVEAAAVARLEAWYRRFGDQMPGCGSAARTAELIRRGVLANEREARFRGFDLGPEQLRRAAEQDACPAEVARHADVLAALLDARGIAMVGHDAG